MSKIKTRTIIGVIVSFFIGFAITAYLMGWGTKGHPLDIRAMARQASVQTVFHVPVLHAYFTEPLPEPDILTAENVKDLLELEQKVIIKRIDEAIDKYKADQKEVKYSTSLTDLEKWGYEPKSKTFIPLGAFAPKYAKFPENILVVCKIEKKEISPWEKEYEEDVLAISETANVSPTKAKEILANIKNKGYSISKEEIKEAEEIELLYFSEWDTQRPTHLDWKVTLEGEDNNLIIGYDPRGILEVKPIPDDKKVYIKAGYFDLLDKYKEEPSEVTTLKKELETVQENLKNAIEEIIKLKEEKDKKPKVKRDIMMATMWDVKFGTVKLDEMYFMSAASGIFLGNMDIRDKKVSTWGPAPGWGYYRSNTEYAKASVILSNAHIVNQAMSFSVMIDEERENLWIIFPGAPSIRHTKHSDYFGTPAWVMGIDEMPVASSDCDAGILLSTPIPEYEQYKVVLGNSNNVKPGDPVIAVGNPAGMQKFTTQGVISNTEYSLLDSLHGSHYLQYIMSKPAYSWLLNSNFWIDTTIGVGGVSGSGVWATEGPEAGKVIAIRNMGMISRFSKATEVKQILINGIDWTKLPDTLMALNETYAKVLFKSSLPSTAYSENFDIFLDKNLSLKQVWEKQYGNYMAMAGMNGCIPINYVKRFLQERGLDPEHFGWEGLKAKYWEK